MQEARSLKTLIDEPHVGPSGKSVSGRQTEKAESGQCTPVAHGIVHWLDTQEEGGDKCGVRRGQAIISSLNDFLVTPTTATCKDPGHYQRQLSRQSKQSTAGRFSSLSPVQPRKPG